MTYAPRLILDLLDALDDADLTAADLIAPELARVIDALLLISPDDRAWIEKAGRLEDENKRLREFIEERGGQSGKPAHITYIPEEGYFLHESLQAAEDQFDYHLKAMRLDAQLDGEWSEEIDRMALYRARPVKTVSLVGSEVAGFDIEVVCPSK